jgi:hypothetical protein
MVTVYRGVLEKPIIYHDSILITPENIEIIDFDKIIYCEVAAEGAMGNVGGILIYTLEDEDTLSTYETNVSIDREMYIAMSERIDQNIDVFDTYHGGFGNYVYIRKGANLEVDTKYSCLWYHSETTKLRVDCSVEGVFLSISSALQ